MADLVTLRKWDGDSASAAQYFTTRDEDFGDPSRIKRIYAVYFSYKASANINMNALLTYALDGGTSFVNTYVPATQLNLSTIWAKGIIEFSTILSAQSIRLKFSHPSGTFEVNEDSIEFRGIHRRIA